MLSSFDSLSLKQKIDIKTRRIHSEYINISGIKTLVSDDAKYTKLLLLILESTVFKNSNEKSDLSIDSLINNDQWLSEVCLKIYSQKGGSKLKHYVSLKKFLSIYKEWIKADIINIQKIMRNCNQELTHKNLIDFGLAYKLEIFESPKIHMNRLWNLKTARMILDKFPNLAADFMKNIDSLDRNVFMEVHRLISKTTNFTTMMYNKYASYYKLNNEYRKCSRYFMIYLNVNNIQYEDLKEPAYQFDELECNETDNLPNEKENQQNLDSTVTISSNNELHDYSDIEVLFDIEEERVNHVDKKKKTNLESESDKEIKKENDDQAQTINQASDATNEATTQTEKPLGLCKIDAESQTDFKFLLFYEHSSDGVRTFSRLSKNLCSLYSKKELTDVLIETGADYKFSVHSCVLASYSEVFKKMFLNGEKVVKMRNASVYAIDAMMLYMYTNCIENLGDVAADLIVLAKEYAIQELVDLCEKFLLKNITIETVSSIFLAAHICKCDKLKIETKKFIASHIKNVIETDGFKKIQKIEPNLVIDLFLYQVKCSES